MLGWLAAAAAPLLIHLWSRHRYREVPWAAMAFLLAAMRKNARRMQLQQWLLLAVRTLLICARGAGRGRAVRRASRRRLERRADASRCWSSTRRFRWPTATSETSRLAQAKQLAAELVAQERAGRRVHRDRRWPIRRGTRRPRGRRSAAVAPDRRARATHGRATLRPRSTWSRRLATRRRSTARASIGRKCISSPTCSGRPGAGSGSPDGSNAFATLAKQAALVGRRRRHAARGQSRRHRSARRRAVRHGRPRGDVRRHAAPVRRPAARTACVVEFLVDDLPVGEQTIDIPAGGDAMRRDSRIASAPPAATPSPSPSARRATGSTSTTRAGSPCRSTSA